MNFTTLNRTIITCGFSFLPFNPENISPELRAVSIVRITVNALTCPLIILLNIQVMVAVKTKRQLRTKSNIALACLATTDLVVGLVVQPLHVAQDSLLLKGESDMVCTLTSASQTVSVTCLVVSFAHLVLMSAERYVAIKSPFTYEIRVTEARIIIASALAWMAVIILPLEDILMGNGRCVTKIAIAVVSFLFFSGILYLNVAVYKEVRRNEKQIAANQVSQEAKEKLIKNKKAFYTTVIVLLTIFICYIPVRFCAIVLTLFQQKFSANVKRTVYLLLALLPVLNSLFNPLIYAVRMRSFRVAFIQLLSRKTLAQAEELEWKMFGPKQIGVTSNVEQEQNIRTSPDVR